MTQLKLISREPTEEMLDYLFGAEQGYSECTRFKNAWAAAPYIETEAEKKAIEFLAWAEPMVLYASTQNAVSIIHALLLERGIK